VISKITWAERCVSFSFSDAVLTALAVASCLGLMSAANHNAVSPKALTKALRKVLPPDLFFDDLLAIVVEYCARVIWIGTLAPTRASAPFPPYSLTLK
jgi:hypothetical protein